MKTVFGILKGLVDILIIAVELLLCASIVLFLVTNPITSPILKKSIPVDRGSVRALSSPTPTPTPTPSAFELESDVSFVLPALEWVPETWMPAKHWGYDQKFSSTRLERVPGYWRLTSGNPNSTTSSEWGPLMYYEVWNIPSLFAETF